MRQENALRKSLKRQHNAIFLSDTVEGVKITNIYLVGNLEGERRKHGRAVIFEKLADHFPELKKQLSSQTERSHRVVGVIFKIYNEHINKF